MITNLKTASELPPHANDTDLSYTTRFPADNEGCWLLAGIDFEKQRAAWLRTKLARDRTRCVLVFTHPFLNSSGEHGKGKTYEPMKQIIEVMYTSGATVLVSAHDHHLEQFAKQNAAGAPAPENGVRPFVVGTGGANLYKIALRPDGRPVKEHPLSEKFGQTTRGLLKLTLYRDGYKWSFVAVGGPAVELPVGSKSCNRRPP